MLEALCHDRNSFVTLTYSDDFVPSDYSLKPKHAQDWIKRLRKRVQPAKLRFFLVGEYGDKTNRPHYHAILFGYPSCSYTRPIVSKTSNCPCKPCTILQETWNYGHTHLGTLTKDSAQYTASYTIKKMTSKDDDRLDGRHPEFSRQSNRPGIGALFVDKIAKALPSEYGALALVDDDVPSFIKYGASSHPIGKYLKRKVREALGRSSTTPDHIVQAYMKDAQDWLREYLQSHGSTIKRKDKHSIAYRERFRGSVNHVEAKYNLYSNKRGSL